MFKSLITSIIDDLRVSCASDFTEYQATALGLCDLFSVYIIHSAILHDDFHTSF